MRRLAYKIKKANNAHSMSMNFELDVTYIKFKIMLDQDERVIRHLVIKRDEAITEDCPPPPEFHTLRANADDNDSKELDEDYDDRDGDEVDDYDDGDEIIFIDGDEDDIDFLDFLHRPNVKSVGLVGCIKSLYSRESQRSLVWACAPYT
ncbi:30S ribosomal protein S6 [Spatholobus suberectus]|nr:30S ribosomal protein S6 [Spatholobus suberectus]